MSITEIETQAAIVREARKQRYQITKQNTTLREENKRRMERNKKLREQHQQAKWGQKKHVPKTEELLVYEVPEQYNKILRNETKVHQQLKDRHPVDWYQRIMELPTRMRDRIACYVWWDYCYDSSSTLYEKHIQQDLEKQSYKKTNRNEIIEALVQLGYTPYAATQRVSK